MVHPDDRSISRMDPVCAHWPSRNRDVAPTPIERPEPEPAAGEILIRVEAASINGFDAAVAAGYVWDMLPHEFPVVLGRDCAGTVDSVGPGVDGIAVGDRVCSVIPGVGLGPTGTLAGRFTAPASRVARAPASVTAPQAAAIGLAGAAALDVVEALDVKDGDVVLVSGATGGVGSFAVQLLAQRGARLPGPHARGRARWSRPGDPRRRHPRRQRALIHERPEESFNVVRQSRHEADCAIAPHLSQRRAEPPTAGSISASPAA